MEIAQNNNRRIREPFNSLVLYRALKWGFVNPVFRTYFRGHVYGVENVPQQGAFIAVSNHASNFDPPILSNCLCRPVAFMAKEELFRVPVLKQAIRLYGAYPVKRGAGDRAAIRAALEALEQGWGVGIFLQGTRTPDGTITDPKQGAALIAAKAQVPLIPVSLWGSEKIFVKGQSIPQSVPLTIRIGAAIAPPPTVKKEALASVTEACATSINAMHALGR